MFIHTEGQGEVMCVPRTRLLSVSAASVSSCPMFCFCSTGSWTQSLEHTRQAPYHWGILPLQFSGPFYKEVNSACGRLQEELFTVCFVLYPCSLSTYDIVITTYSLLAKEIPTTKQEGEVPGSNLSVEVRLGDAREERLRMPAGWGLGMPGKWRWRHT